MHKCMYAYTVKSILLLIPLLFFLQSSFWHLHWHKHCVSRGAAGGEYMSVSEGQTGGEGGFCWTGADIDTALTWMKIFSMFSEHERNAARRLDMAYSNKRQTSALNQKVFSLTRHPKTAAKGSRPSVMWHVKFSDHETCHLWNLLHSQNSDRAE